MEFFVSYCARLANPAYCFLPSAFCLLPSHFTLSSNGISNIASPAFILSNNMA